MNEISEWYGSFVMVLDSVVRCSCAWTKPYLIIKAVMRPMHRGPILTDILSKLACVKYLMSIDASSGYDNLKVEE